MRLRSFNRAMRWVLLANAIASWIIFATMFAWDWTVVFVPLIATAGSAAYFLSVRKAYPPPAPPRPDYSRIATLEREIYGETCPLRRPFTWCYSGHCSSCERVYPG